MKSIQFIGFFLVFLFSFQSGNTQIKIYEKFDAFDKEVLQHIDADETIIINFWATWCKPCVKELPYFEAITEEGKYKVVLVSLDFQKNIDNRLLPFIEDRQLQSEVMALTDPKYNDWIDRLDPRWSGAIPATLFYKNGQKLFKEKSYHSKDEILGDLNSF